jgi:hypothetical protein
VAESTPESVINIIGSAAKIARVPKASVWNFVRIRHAPPGRIPKGQILVKPRIVARMLQRAQTLQPRRELPLEMVNPIYESLATISSTATI